MSSQYNQTNMFPQQSQTQQTENRFPQFIQTSGFESSNVEMLHSEAMDVDIDDISDDIKPIIRVSPSGISDGFIWYLEDILENVPAHDNMEYNRMNLPIFTTDEQRLKYISKYPVISDEEYKRANPIFQMNYDYARRTSLQTKLNSMDTFWNGDDDAKKEFWTSLNYVINSEVRDYYYLQAEESYDRLRVNRFKSLLEKRSIERAVPNLKKNVTGRSHFYMGDLSSMQWSLLFDDLKASCLPDVIKYQYYYYIDEFGLRASSKTILVCWKDQKLPSLQHPSWGYSKFCDRQNRLYRSCISKFSLSYNQITYLVKVELAYEVEAWNGRF